MSFVCHRILFTHSLNFHLVLYMNNIPTWVALVASLIVGIVAAILVQLFIVPWQRKKILGQSQAKKPVKFTIEGSSGKCNRKSFQLRNLLAP